MKLIIMADGTPNGTNVYDAETGTELNDIVNINVNMDANINGGAPIVTITLMNVPIKVVANAVEFYPPGYTGFWGE